MVKDPVCGRKIEEEETSYYTHFRHKTIFFCSELCKRSYDRADTGKRSWWRILLDRIIDANVRVFGRVSSKNAHEGRAEYPLIQQAVRLPKIEIEIDPVCQMEVWKGIASAIRQYKGQKYYFCSSGCAKRFDENPAIYTKGMNESNKEKDTHA